MVFEVEKPFGTSKLDDYLTLFGSNEVADFEVGNVTNRKDGKQYYSKKEMAVTLYIKLEGSIRVLHLKIESSIIVNSSTLLLLGPRGPS